MKISDILKVERIIPNLEKIDKTEIINEIIDLFADDDRVLDLEVVRNAVHDREKIMSTGVGQGFAIPHAKTNGVTEMIAAFAKTSEPIDFNALDQNPVNLIFLLVGKENLVGPHIKLLSRISRMMNKEEFRKSLSEAKSSEEILSIFSEEENKHFEIR
ncbi:MAG: PTS sugar transporter subunit IIA [Melioribacteraceae bacterium]|nr:PTS sugar transporter subunit IIA [Melioribacteraceae bacterium]MCF8354283.1 PTS sugar transporter subunit IIA [Melioribacteraceae bacterium]MCF8394585.1 PTS sugar transporter subunit IIA [Melioribacteraceae bacterium]MCF8419746.1 PTS sugar transporter subunit IIA [Melioribacteraceae bacterium]